MCSASILWSFDGVVARQRVTWWIGKPQLHSASFWMSDYVDHTTAWVSNCSFSVTYRKTSCQWTWLGSRMWRCWLKSARSTVRGTDSYSDTPSHRWRSRRGSTEVARFRHRVQALTFSSFACFCWHPSATTGLDSFLSATLSRIVKSCPCPSLPGPFIQGRRHRCRAIFTTLSNRQRNHQHQEDGGT